ncbi:cyclase family protein [Alkalihalobacillus sp. 1P02AB]|uniref:cyclase family protein n=1 Tax=Alkalihalobacillus sp. 1P02AB TaxID=3132260 RepID=UPI0039A6D373
MRKLISYPMNSNDPGWPNNPKMKVSPFTQIANGDTTNQYIIEFFNHFGSHMDGSNHFVDNGPRLYETDINMFFYDAPLLIDIEKTYGELIHTTDLMKYEKEIEQADLLMIRTGFSQFRREDPKGYSENGPGITSDACKYLVEHFVNLKAVALDWISLSSYPHRKEGALAHQYLLGEFQSRFLFIIEDLNFEGLNNNTLNRVVALPLLIEGIDSAPCTVVAEINIKGTHS